MGNRKPPIEGVPVAQLLLLLRWQSIRPFMLRALKQSSPELIKSIRNSCADIRQTSIYHVSIEHQAAM